MSYNAFTSVNWPLAAIIRGGRVVREGGGSSSVASASVRPLFSHTLDEHVVVLKLTPGLQPSVFDALSTSCSAVILETFGIGGIPEGFEQTLFDWVDAGHTLVLTTQVPEEGLDLGVYEVGRAYAQRSGILLGGDMTVEALVAKTMWVCGTSDHRDVRERLFYQSINHDRLA
jgi:L-asparaginase